MQRWSDVPRHAIKADALKQSAQVARCALVKVEVTCLSATGESEPRLKQFQLDLQAGDAPNQRPAAFAEVVVAALIRRVQAIDVVEPTRPTRRSFLALSANATPACVQNTRKSLRGCWRKSAMLSARQQARLKNTHGLP